MTKLAYQDTSSTTTTTNQLFSPIFQVVLFALVAAVYAEAEADPALLYTGLGLPYAYGAYGLAATPFKSAPCVNAANVPVPCAAGNIAYAAYASPYLYGRKNSSLRRCPRIRLRRTSLRLRRSLRSHPPLQPRCLP